MEHIMDRVHTCTAETPSLGVHDGDASFPGRAFGYGTTRYRAFLEALLEGLLLYESLQGVRTRHAQEPVPAA
jgi:hypothetical protein